jgi:SAM-dependent methyltransferase
MVRDVTGSLLTRARTSLQMRSLDAADALRGRRDARVPPRRLDFVGHSDFVATGDEFLEHFVALGGLTAQQRVLDVGCGIGRMARPLAGFLHDGGSYDGFDINPQGIDWCVSHYRDRPSFRFRLADLHNSVYNPSGAVPAIDYRFPYDDGAFDFVFATSVFTHLVSDEALHYLDEVTRVLVPGGCMLLTFFVLDETSRALLAQGRSALAFTPLDDHSAVTDHDVPEAAIAYDERWLCDALAARGVRDAVVHPGAWSGRAPSTSYQDIVVAHRG